MAVGACRNCIHRNGTLSWGRCAATGFFMEVERKSGGPCGWQGALWSPMPERKPGIFERTWRWLFGYRPLGVEAVATQDPS